MKCEIVKLPDGGSAIVCSRGRAAKKCSCGKPAHLLCDWKMPGGKTCDAPICAVHAQEVAPDKHLCQLHQVAYREWLAGQRKPEPRAADGMPENFGEGEV